MEADWEVELGGGAPVIEPQWLGFLDLRLSPESAHQLQEAAQIPRLAEVLIRLNADRSPVWTSKCDVWTVGEFDPDELDSPHEQALHAVACYVDLLPKGDEQWVTPAATAAWCGDICTTLKACPMCCCRADLVVRHAMVSPERTEFGITAYVTACGPTPGNACDVLAAALAALADSLTSGAPADTAASQLQYGDVGE